MSRIPQHEPWAFNIAIFNSRCDEEALEVCKTLHNQHPKWNPDYWGSNSHNGPLHLSVAFRWIETTKRLLQHCNPAKPNVTGQLVWELCYAEKIQMSIIASPPSLEIAELLAEVHDPRVMCRWEGNDVPLYNMGQKWIESNLHPESNAAFAEMDAFFLKACKGWQVKTKKGVDGFPIL